ncbi:hypothetical protein D7I39_18115, partial [Allopusillimonas ginsengisoli]
MFLFFFVFAMSQSIHLLVIDPQNDFCDLPENMLPADPLKPSQGRGCVKTHFGFSSPAVGAELHHNFP